MMKLPSSSTYSTKTNRNQATVNMKRIGTLVLLNDTIIIRMRTYY